MQLKINFLCRDSILAAPIVLDVALFLDLAKRAGMHGIQEWLSFYFKSPMHAPGLYPEHDLFIQLMKLKNTLRYLQGRRAHHASRPWSTTTEVPSYSSAGAVRRPRHGRAVGAADHLASATLLLPVGRQRRRRRRVPVPAEPPDPMTAADGALVGLLAGLIGACSARSSSIPMMMLMGGDGAAHHASGSSTFATLTFRRRSRHDDRGA